MWTCSFCQTINSDSDALCAHCGKPKTDPDISGNDRTGSDNSTVTDAGPQSTGDSVSKKKAGKKLWIAVVAVIALMVIGFFTVHIWEPATCTEPETCRICGKERGTPADHQWIPATCTEPSICRICGATTGWELGHKWAKATCTEPETCKRCGATQGSTADHDWMPATCTEPMTCRNCGATQGSASGHDWKDATCTEPQTCRICGATQGSASGHDWKDATCTSPKTCKTCGATSGSALGHDWKAATYDAPETCKRCGTTRGDVKGYIDYLSGHVSSKSEIIRGNQLSYPYILDSKVKDCIKLTVHLKITDYEGKIFGTWFLYGRSKGKWTKIGEFKVTEKATEDYQDYEITFSKPVSFDALYICMKNWANKNNWSYNYSFAFKDVQIK